MNRWFWRAIIAGVLVVTAVFIYNVFFPSPERVIRARLTELAKTASFRGNEPPLTAMANAQRVAGFFVEDVQIQVELPGRVGATISGRDEVREKTLALRSLGGGLQVEFLDINVTLSPDKNSAEAILTLKGRIAGEKDLIVQELKFLLNKIDGDWKIKHIEAVKTLSFRGWPIGDQKYSNANIQRPEKLQEPNSKPSPRMLELEFWSFSGCWMLALGCFIT